MQYNTVLMKKKYKKMTSCVNATLWIEWTGITDTKKLELFHDLDQF